MDKEIIVRLHSSFEDVVRKHAESGVEYWCARDLQMLLGYARWENFAKVVDKAITACDNSGYEPKDHFAGINKMVDLGSGAKDHFADPTKMVERRLVSEQKKLPRQVEPFEGDTETGN